MPEITQYETEDGGVPFEEWFDSLDTQPALRVTTALARMKSGNFGDHKSVGEGVWEHRIHVGKGFRVYFGKDGDTLVVLCWGGTKKRQNADIEKAKGYWADYKARKKREKSKKKTRKGNK